MTLDEMKGVEQRCVEVADRLRVKKDPLHQVYGALASQWVMTREICERLDRVIAALDEGLKAPIPVEVCDG